ncbi:MAG: HD-GYP domain-containing protein [Planctomycetota bacterium]|jgi:putative nucleotidyltransferase with HDIG domain
MEYEISPDYMPISPSALRTDTTVGCDIYILAKTSTETRFVLCCKADAVFDEAKKSMLLAQRIKRFFIAKDDQQKYYQYLESNFQNIISDTRLSSEGKTQSVHSAATNLVNDLFNDPRSGNVERAKTFAYSMVDHVLKDSKATHSLLKIAIHEYNTYTHSVNVAAVGTLFGQDIGLGVTDLKGLCAGILLHDIGKTRISTAILNKKGELTKEEFEIMKKHPEHGADILDETGTKFKEERIITLQHHENDDGSGYPYGLRKDEIHLCGKIARIIDVYDALTSNRPYKDALRPFAALVEMKEKMANCFDPELFKEFIRFLGPYDPRKKPRQKDKLYG